MNWDENSSGPWGQPTGAKSGQKKPVKNAKVIKLNAKKPGGFFEKNPKYYGLLVIVAILFWLGSGFYMVQPDEQGVQMVFGKWNGVVKEAGLHYNFPSPIGKTFTPQVTQEQQIEIGYRSGGGKSHSSMASQQKMINRGYQNSNVAGESLMLTGDGNIIDIDFVVTYKISDAGKYLFNIRNPQETLKKVSESAMREIIGRSELQKALADERALIQQETLDLIQKTMDDYDSGIQVNEVKLQRVDPPAEVIESFNDVQRALSDKETLSNEADAYKNKIIPEAKGIAEEMIQEAEGYKAKVVNVAKGESDRFNQIYKSYAKSKEITKTRMYLETMEEVMKNSEKVIVNKGAGSSILPHMNIRGEGIK